MDKSEKYLSSQLIAYIGNKRRLLGFLREVFSELNSRNGGTVVRFADCFAGSGAVSRLAKSMGFSVGANDWEFYSWLINKAHIELTPAMLDDLFAEEGGAGGRLDYLNSLSRQPEGLASDGGAYISRYYAPGNTAAADFRLERLFYTRENAVFIDRVRNEIESWYPGWELSGEDLLRKASLLAPLLYQAATHANTNGVFKAYHKGFGGHGSDALGRIMADMKLISPALIDAPEGRKFFVERKDAEVFACNHSFDICYLDPPYNQHQYGSNYFMLNTIALWDRPEVSLARNTDGTLAVKAGIRSDWTETRSDFCYKKTAPDALRRLIDKIDARYIVLSYNTEGIIDFDELYDILSSFGRTEIFCRDYIIYRGGRQSIGRANRNVEFQLVLTKTERAVSSDRSMIDKILSVRSIISLMNESFCPQRITEQFNPENGRVSLFPEGPTVGMRAYYRFTEIPPLSDFDCFNLDAVNRLHERLMRCRCRDKREEAEILIELIRCSPSEEQKKSGKAVYRKLWADLFRTVRKFAFSKYAAVFEQMYKRLTLLIEEERTAGKPGNWDSIEKKAAELRRVADLRLEK